MDVVDAGDLFWWGFWAAALLIGRLVVVHHQFLHLHEALDDRDQPGVGIWELQQPTGQNKNKETIYKSADMEVI